MICRVPTERIATPCIPTISCRVLLLPSRRRHACQAHPQHPCRRCNSVGRHEAHGPHQWTQWMSKAPLVVAVYPRRPGMPTHRRLGLPCLHHVRSAWPAAPVQRRRPQRMLCGCIRCLVVISMSRSVSHPLHLPMSQPPRSLCCLILPNLAVSPCDGDRRPCHCSRPSRPFRLAVWIRGAAIRACRTGAFTLTREHSKPVLERHGPRPPALRHRVRLEA